MATADDPLILLPRRRAMAVVAGLPMGLAACASKPPPPASVMGQSVAADDLNPSAGNRPSPLPLRLFELRSATAFNKADFLPLYQADAQTLGAEMIGREELVLAPGETRPLQKTLDPQTRFIGVFAAYRSFERAVWRAVAPVQPGRKHQLRIRAASLAVSIELQLV